MTTDMHLIVATFARDIQHRPELQDAVHRKEARLATRQYAMRGLRPDKITVLGTPFGMTFYELVHEIDAMKLGRDDVVVTWL